MHFRKYACLNENRKVSEYVKQSSILWKEMETIFVAKIVKSYEALM